jgi:hypothetical protein
MLYVRYVHLTKVKHIHKSTPILSSEILFLKDYDRKGSLEKVSGREPQGAWGHDKLIGSKPPVVK